MSEVQDLQQIEAIDKLRDLAESIDICLFGSGADKADGSSFRPMSTKLVDADGNILFFSDRNSLKNREIEADSRVKLYYSDPRKSSFLIVEGVASISSDREMISELWNSLDKTWFKEGESDPAISIISVRPESAHYWDVDG